jgi:sugar lactone lactonase YvrE
MKWRNAALAAMLLTGAAVAQAASAPADIPMNGSRIFPESITSDAAGNIYTGSLDGTIYRAAKGATSADPWIRPDAHNGLTSVFGVLADDSHHMLWACNNPGFGGPPKPGATTSVRGFGLASGQLDAVYEMPAGKPATCNDIAIAPDGTLWASETSSGRIFHLAKGSNGLSTFADSPDLVGIDGLAFAADGTLYINNVRKNLLQRVNRNADGTYAGLTALALNDKLNGPDGLRAIGGNTFLLAEGPGGRVALIVVSGDSATVTPLKTGLNSSPAVTRVGRTAYATEGKINYLFDPKLKDQSPDPFVIRAFTLPEGL